MISNTQYITLSEFISLILCSFFFGRYNVWQKKRHYSAALLY